jgi:nucleoside-diphosphate-sugar epimerase
VVFGAGDRGLLRFFRAASRGFVPVPAGRSRIQVIEASRAALAVAFCLRQPALARKTAFLCDPDPVQIQALTAMIAKLPDRPAQLVGVPDWFVRVAGLVTTLSESVTGRSLSFNSDKAKEILAGDWLCDPALMQRHLSLPPPSPLQYGLKKTWEWYRARGWLPSPSG